MVSGAANDAAPHSPKAVEDDGRYSGISPLPLEFITGKVFEQLTENVPFPDNPSTVPLLCEVADHLTVLGLGSAFEPF